MTAGEAMTVEAVTHIARRDYSHKVWLKRQADYQKIKDQDCYGYKSAKVQNMGRACQRSSQAC